MPEIVATQDFKPDSLAQVLELYKIRPDNKELADAIAEVLPLLTLDDLRKPVRQKLLVNPHAPVTPLFVNRQGDLLAFSLKDGEGKIIVLPEYDDNEYVITNFLNRVLPRLHGGPILRDIVDAFASPLEQAAKQEIQTVESEREALDARIEQTREKLATGERLKKKTIAADETAARIISYYRLATQQEDVALFYLYKVIEAVEKHFGSEKAAKDRLGRHPEWNLIGKLANASYADIRHAPKPGEKIKQWSKDEIDQCFAAARQILHAYFSTLF